MIVTSSSSRMEKHVQVAGHGRLSGWELREKQKRSIPGRIKRYSASSTHTRRIPADDSESLPPAFKALHQSLSEIKTEDCGFACAYAQDLQQSDEEEQKRKIRLRQSKERRSNVFDALAKHAEASASVDDDISLGSFCGEKTVVSQVSLGSQPPVRRQAVLSCTRKVESALNLSMDFSTHAQDFHDEGTGALSSGASDEQWARFKLLGRIGLGELEVSDVVQLMIERSVKIFEGAVRNIMALRDTDRVTSFDVVDTLDLRTGKVLEEVSRTVELPIAPYQFKRNPESLLLPADVKEQLRDFITVISKMYRNNPFHNFEHACSVLNNVNKLLSMVEIPRETDPADIRLVTTDPWTQFALVFAALVHDVDHSGVPNAQLIKEKAQVANAYKNKSVAEQNSVELAWNLLIEPCYKELRSCIFQSWQEVSRFRGLVVTAVMATDIADKELAALRKGRAADAISDECMETTDDIISRRATFVLETLIQAADVSHTMQPFHVYKRWNRKLYNEILAAFKAGRAEKDPTDGWYKGDLGFFDFYIIPLAKKLKRCGIFEDECERYISSAISNRSQWEKEGESIVSEYVQDSTSSVVEASAKASIHTPEAKRSGKSNLQGKGAIPSISQVSSRWDSSSSSESSFADGEIGGESDSDSGLKELTPRDSLLVSVPQTRKNGQEGTKNVLANARSPPSPRRLVARSKSDEMSLRPGMLSSTGNAKACDSVAESSLSSNSEAYCGRKRAKSLDRTRLKHSLAPEMKNAPRGLRRAGHIECGRPPLQQARIPSQDSKLRRSRSKERPNAVFKKTTLARSVSRDRPRAKLQQHQPRNYSESPTSKARAAGSPASEKAKYRRLRASSHEKKQQLRSASSDRVSSDTAIQQSARYRKGTKDPMRLSSHAERTKRENFRISPQGHGKERSLSRDRTPTRRIPSSSERIGRTSVNVQDFLISSDAGGKKRSTSRPRTSVSERAGRSTVDAREFLALESESKRTPIYLSANARTMRRQHSSSERKGRATSEADSYMAGEKYNPKRLARQKIRRLPAQLEKGNR